MVEEGSQDSDRPHAGDQEIASLQLALAKLLFQQGQKSEAYELCERVFTNFEASLEWSQIKHMNVVGVFNAAGDTDGSSVEEAANEAAEAYQLGGWIKIHCDDHTSAYAIWSRGHAAVPSCPFLARQAGKRSCWDLYYSANRNKTLQLQRDAAEARDFIGGGAHGDGRFDSHQDLDAFAVPNNQTASACTP
jgi:hypothetical protein